MKKYLLILSLVAIFHTVYSQEPLAPNQNPNFAVSRAKYMQMSDSITAWQGTTSQDTYKAIDWMVDRQEARENRREFRRQLRMERARWSNYYYNDNYRGRYFNNY
ncbi:MAG TPA: hypothetical protein VHM26_05680, partial [Chitinophagaceae bacterium]|nr:hypothetical protein [Chitinophagaceae bacterium]